MNQVLMVIMAVGAVVGGLDRIFGNRLGYGAKFEEGFGLMGSTALSMAGMICLAPVLSNLLGKLIIPLYQLLGVDPGMFGSFLAIDMGGYQLAGELAENPAIGDYAGIVVAAIFGCTIVFTIPVGMGIVKGEDRTFFAKGIMLGLITMPVGLVAGGLLCGIPIGNCIHQNLPVLLLAALMLLGLWKKPEWMLRGFCAFAWGIRCVITVGLVLGAVEYMCGWNPLPGMAPLTEAMDVVVSISIIMLGSLPVSEFLKRILKKPFAVLGKRCGMGATGMTGLLVGMISAIPAISMFREMDNRGKVANAAFLVSSTSILAAHLGFTLSVKPELLGPLVLAKLSGGIAAVFLALLLERKAQVRR